MVSMAFPHGTAGEWINEDPQRVRLSYDSALHHRKHRERAAGRLNDAR